MTGVQTCALPIFLDVFDNSYYVYAKVSQLDQTGIFILNESALAIDYFSGYYCLLVAIVNSEYDTDRSIVPLYGFTEILPGRITTKKIVSPDGSTYFDLENNEIRGNISFKSSADTYTNVGTGIAGAITTAATDATTKANEARALAEAVGNQAWDYADQAYNNATDAASTANTAQAGVSALNYLKTALAGTTEIAGGLVATNILLLKNALEQITGGLSGIDDDNIGFWTGGNYNDAIAGLAKIILKKDGSGQLLGGLFKFTADNKLIIDLANFKLSETGDVNIIGSIKSVSGSTSTELKNGFLSFSSVGGTAMLTATSEGPFFFLSKSFDSISMHSDLIEIYRTSDGFRARFSKRGVLFGTVVQGDADTDANAAFTVDNIIHKNLPTSSAGLPVGTFWRDGTYIRISV